MVAVERSGNPGYIRGFPIPKGYLNFDDSSVTVNSLPEDRYLSVVTPSLEDCTNAMANPKTPVGFGYNTISGCFVESVFIFVFSPINCLVELHGIRSDPIQTRS